MLQPQIKGTRWQGFGPESQLSAAVQMLARGLGLLSVKWAHMLLELMCVSEVGDPLHNCSLQQVLHSCRSRSGNGWNKIPFAGPKRWGAGQAWAPEQRREGCVSAWLESKARRVLRDPESDATGFQVTSSPGSLGVVLVASQSHHY